MALVQTWWPPGTYSPQHSALAIRSVTTPTASPCIPYLDDGNRLETVNDEKQHPPVPRIPPAAQDWESIRPLFTRLYVTENMKLREVTLILEQEHGFHATERMYKKRINEWKLHKNYKSAEKMALIRIIKTHKHSDIPSLTLNNRPVKINRLVRYYREKHLGDADLFQANGSVLQKRKAVDLDDIRDTSNMSMMQTLSSSTPAKSVAPQGDVKYAELILFHMHNYFESYFTTGAGLRYLSTSNLQESTETPNMGVASLNADFQDINPGYFIYLHKNARGLLERDQVSAAFVIFHRISEMSKTLFRDQHPLVLPCLLSSLMKKNLDYEDPAIHQTRTLTYNMASTILGTAHPLTVILSTLFVYREEELIFLVWRQSVALLEAWLTPHHEISIQASRDLFSELVWFRRYHEAEQKLKTMEETVSPIREQGFCTALQSYGYRIWLYTKWGKHDDVRDLVPKIMDLVSEVAAFQEDLDTEEWDKVEYEVYATLTRLAEFNRLTGDIEGYLDIQRCVVDISLRRYGLHNQETILTVNYLEFNLRKIGRDDEAAELRAEYPHAFEPYVAECT